MTDLLDRPAIDLPPLADILAGPEPEPDVEPDELDRASTWVVDERAAQRAMGALVKRRGRIAAHEDIAAEWHAEVTKAADARHAEIDAWLESVNREDANRALNLTEHLNRFILHEALTNGVSRVKVPSGVVKVVRRAERVGIVDHDELVPWLLEHPEVEALNDPTASLSKLQAAVRTVEVFPDQWAAVVPEPSPVEGAPPFWVAVPGVTVKPPTITPYVVPNAADAEPGDPFA